MKYIAHLKLLSRSCIKVLSKASVTVDTLLMWSKVWIVQGLSTGVAVKAMLVEYTGLYCHFLCVKHHSATFRASVTLLGHDLGRVHFQWQRNLLRIMSWTVNLLVISDKYLKLIILGSFAFATNKAPRNRFDLKTRIFLRFSIPFVINFLLK